MVLRFFKEGMDATFGETEHDAVHTDELNSDNISALEGLTRSDFARYRRTDTVQDSTSTHHLIAKISSGEAQSISVKLIDGHHGDDSGEPHEVTLQFRTDGHEDTVRAYHSVSGGTESTRTRLYLTRAERDDGNWDYWLCAYGQYQHYGKIIVESGRRDIEWIGESDPDDGIPGVQVYSTEDEDPSDTQWVGSVHATGEMTVGGNTVMTSSDMDTAGLAVPAEHTLQSIQETLDEHREVRLERGVVYEGTHTIEIWPQDDDGTPRDYRIDARGAAVNYIGSGETAVEIGPHENNWSGRVHVEGGKWSGPGHYDGTDSAIRVTDHFGADIRVNNALNAEHGVLVRNVDAFCERTTAHVGEPYQGFDGSADLGSPPIYSVRFAGYESEYVDDSMSMTNDSPWNGWDGDPNTASTGTGSFRESDVSVKFMSPQDGGKYFWQDKAEMQGGNTAVAGFVPANGHMVHSDGWNPGHTIEVETEGVDSGIAVENNNDSPPLIINPRLSGQGFINTGAGNMRVIRRDGDQYVGAEGRASDEAQYRIEHAFDYPRTIINDELRVNNPRTSYNDVRLLVLQQGGNDHLTFFKNGAWSRLDFRSENGWPVYFLDSNEEPVSIRAEDVDIGSNGGSIYMNSDGDACVDDENGNTINLSNL